VKRLVEFRTDDGNAIVVEVDEPEVLGGTVRAARKPGQLLDEAKDSFDEALNKIYSATESAVRTLRTLSSQPDEVIMEFGFNLSAQFGAVIASATASANYKVVLKWSRPEREELDVRMK